MNVAKQYLGGSYKVSVQLGKYQSFTRNYPHTSILLDYYTIGYTDGGIRKNIVTRSKKQMRKILEKYGVKYLAD